jgi:glutamate-1-semialdehyde aminotransferase
MNAMGADVRSRLSAAFSGLPLQVTGQGSLFKVSASHEPISDYRNAVTSAREWEELASIALWTEGCWLAPRLHGCVSAVTTQADQNRLVDTFKRVIAADWRPS